MSNVFDQAANKVKASYLSILLFIASFVMLFSGVNHFVEDTMSSYYGVQMLEELLGMRPTTYSLTYWTMSISPQVAQILFIYLYLSDTRKFRWARLAAVIALLVDFSADVWYRSGEQMDFVVLFASFMLTLAYFTIGSEFFISIGFGLVLSLFKPAMDQLGRWTSAIWDFVESLVREKGSHQIKQHDSLRPCPVCGKKVKNVRAHIDDVHGPEEAPKAQKARRKK